MSTLTRKQFFKENYKKGFVFYTTLTTGHQVFIKVMKSNKEVSVPKSVRNQIPKFEMNAKTVYNKVCTYHSKENGFEEYYEQVEKGKWFALTPVKQGVIGEGKYFIHNEEQNPRNVYKTLFEDEGVFGLLKGEKFSLVDSFDTEYKAFYKDDKGNILPDPKTEEDYVYYVSKGWQTQYKQLLSLHKVIKSGNYVVKFAIFPSMYELQNAYEGKFEDSRSRIDGEEYFGLDLEFCGCYSQTQQHKNRITKGGKDENGKRIKSSPFTPMTILGHNIQADLFFLSMPEITFFDTKTGKQIRKSDFENAKYNLDFIRYLVGLNGGLETLNTPNLIITHNGRCYPIILTVRDTMNHSVTKSKSLAELGEVCGFPKEEMSKEEITNMHKVIFDNTDKYLTYAEQDPLIPFVYVSALYGENTKIKMTFLSAVVPIIVERMKKYCLEKLDLASWVNYAYEKRIIMKFFEYDKNNYIEHTVNTLHKKYSKERLFYTRKNRIIFIKTKDNKGFESIVEITNGKIKEYEIKSLTDEFFQFIFQGVVDRSTNKQFVKDNNSKSSAVFMSKAKSFYGLRSDIITDLCTNSYHGGMNDCRYIGIYKEKTQDLDLKSAYMTSERLLPLPDWREPFVEILTCTKSKEETYKVFNKENGMDIFEPYRKYNNGEIPMELMCSTVIEIAGWKHPQEQVRCEDGVLWSTVPYIPFAVEGTIGYAEEHQTGWCGVGSMTITGSEYIKTIEEGGEVYVMQVYLINPLRDKEGNILHLVGDTAQHFITTRETNQKLYGKKSLPDLMSKEMNNGCLYGKIAQNVSKKSVYDPRTPQGLEITEENIDKGASPLTNPFIVCNITANIRCMLTASHNACIRAGLGGFQQITTDGGNSRVSAEVLNTIDTGFIGKLFKKSRLEITNGQSDIIYEVKANNESSVAFTTRRNLSLTVSGIIALTGYKSLYKKGTLEQKIEFLRKYVSNEPVVSVNSYAKGCLPNAQKKFEKYIPYDSIKVSYGNSNYDFKYQPVIEEMQNVYYNQYEEITGEEFIIASGSTKAWATTKELCNAISYMHNHKYSLVREVEDYETTLKAIEYFENGYSSIRARQRGEIVDSLLCYVSAMYGRFNDTFIEGVYDLTPKKLAELLNERFELEGSEVITPKDISNAKRRLNSMPFYYLTQIEVIKNILSRPF